MNAPDDAGRDRAARAAGARERPHARADHGRRQRGRDGREHLGADRRQGHRRRLERLAVLLRDEIVPATVGALPDAEAGVTGLTAQWKDSTDEMKSKLPLVVGFVLVFAFALMLVAFRSPVIAAKAIVLNLLSVARRLRRAGARLPARLRQWPARLQLHGRDRPGGAAAPVRDPVRALDGLPRVPPEPDPRGRPAGRDAPTRRSRTGSSRPPASSPAPRSSWSACSPSSRRSRC